jgi:hypothetical protein
MLSGLSLGKVLSISEAIGATPPPGPQPAPRASMARSNRASKR